MDSAPPFGAARFAEQDFGHEDDAQVVGPGDGDERFDVAGPGGSLGVVGDAPTGGVFLVAAETDGDAVGPQGGDLANLRGQARHHVVGPVDLYGQSVHGH